MNNLNVYPVVVSSGSRCINFNAIDSTYLTSMSLSQLHSVCVCCVKNAPRIEVGVFMCGEADLSRASLNSCSSFAALASCSAWYLSRSSGGRLSTALRLQRCKHNWHLWVEHNTTPRGDAVSLFVGVRRDRVVTLASERLHNWRIRRATTSRLRTSRLGVSCAISTWKKHSSV